MISVAGVRFKRAGKVYFFDPAGLEVSKGTNVIVETARGLEFGTLSDDIKEVDEKEIVSPLKRIVRIADEKDVQQHRENLKRKEHDLILCQEKINKHKLDMKLVDVEHTFDNSKIIFYFTADGRVDFRELVKDLASVFKMRIELRQIGVRDEAKLIGGIGTCGKALCCHSWLPEFEPVSIKMAKVQNLSLNPTKISGICGRLMCCLKFENDVYCELRRGMPDVGEKVKTPDGLAIVVESNILGNRIKVHTIIEEKEGDRPEKLSSEAEIYTKEQIRRLGNKKNSDFIDDEIDSSLLNEIKSLLQD
ncbi:MAG TPA: stage 0 sporulation family protein [Bacillota bacterium]|jgi:cell fate regulator YaaT (PSP1 superfamily)|nr:stage 0 sporulation family protein [Bacillota bacterium]